MWCFKQEGDFYHRVDLKDRCAHSSGVLIPSMKAHARMKDQLWKCLCQCQACTHSPHPPSHVFSMQMCLCTYMGKCHEASSCVTGMGICRSTEAHHKPAMLADETKEETATRKLEIMTSTFTCKTAITQPAHSLASLWRKQIYLLERCLYCDLTFKRKGRNCPSFSMFYFSDSHSLLLEAQASPRTSPWLLAPLKSAMAGRLKAQTCKQEPSKLQLVSSSIIHTFNTMELALLMLHGRKFY